MSYRPPRYPANTPITLSVNAHRNAARIVNVANSGLKLQGVDMPEVGHEVRISSGTSLLTGEIVWVDGDVAGVELDQPLTAAQMAWLRGAPQGPNAASGKTTRAHNAGLFREM